MLVSDAFTHFSIERKLNGGSEKTARNYRSVLNSLLAATDDIAVELLTYEHLLRWKMKLDAEGKSPTTISSNLSSLREVLKYLRKHGLNVIDPRDIELPRKIVREPDYLDRPEVRDMIECAIRPRDKALIATLWSTGGRISEVLSFDRDTVKDGQAVVLGKGSKYVTLYIDYYAQKLIDHYLDERTDKLPPLFISGQMRRLTVSRAEQVINQIAAETGITKHVTPHTFRHSYATDLLKNGADLRSVQTLLHHSQITTTMRYTHVSDKAKEEAYKRHHLPL